MVKYALLEKNGPTLTEDMADDFKHKIMSLVTVTVLMVVFSVQLENEVS
jgi:hypothetical protein